MVELNGVLTKRARSTKTSGDAIPAAARSLASPRPRTRTGGATARRQAAIRSWRAGYGFSSKRGERKTGRFSIVATFRFSGSLAPR